MENSCTPGETRGILGLGSWDGVYGAVYALRLGNYKLYVAKVWGKVRNGIQRRVEEWENELAVEN